MSNFEFNNLDITGSLDYKLNEGTNGLPDSGYSRIFPKSDDKWYIVNSTGTEYQLSTNDYTTSGLIESVLLNTLHRTGQSFVEAPIEIVDNDKIVFYSSTSGWYVDDVSNIYNYINNESITEWVSDVDRTNIGQKTNSVSTVIMLTDIGDANLYKKEYIDSNFATINYVDTSLENFVTSDYTTAGLVYQTVFDETTSAINNVLNTKATITGNVGEVIIKGTDDITSSTDLTFTNNTLNIIGQGSSNTTISLECQDVLEETTFQVRDDGSIKIKENGNALISEADYASIKMDNNEGYFQLMRSDGEIFYLNIDTFLSGRDVKYSNPVNGDIPVYTETSTGYGYEIRNYNTADFDDILYRTAVNISSDQQLVFSLNAGYGITSIIIEEIGSSDAGDVYVGSTSGGSDIVSFTTLEANDTVKCLISKDFFSLYNDTPLYIGSTTWGSGILNIYVRLEKLIS